MAQGSHKTYAGWEDKTCYKCGGKLTLSGPACLWSYKPDCVSTPDRRWRELPGRGTVRSWHLGKCPT